MRHTNWSATPLGPVDAWPVSLRTIVETLLSCSFPMVALWGPDLIQIYNDGYAHIMGNKHPGGMGQPTAACWPEVWHFNGPIYRQVFEGKTLTFEDQLLPIERNGEINDAYFTLCYSPLRNESEQVAGVLVTVFETTEQKKADDALRESEMLFRALVEASSYAIYRMTPDWSEMRLLSEPGCRADIPVSQRDWLQEYILPEDQPMILQTVQEAIRSGKLLEIEHRVRRADGQIGWTLSRTVPIFDREGRIVQWIGAASDVTERKLAEQELNRTKERLAAVFDCLPIAIGIYDQQGNFVLANREMLRLVPGKIVPSQDDSAAPHWIAYAPDGSVIPHSQYPGARALRGEAIVDAMEILHTADDGASTWTRFASTPVRGEDGELLEQVLTITDIDALKKKSEDLGEQVEIASEALGRTREELRALSHYLMTAQEDERRRIAQDIHDDLGQRAALLGMKVNGLQAQLPQAIAADLESISDDISELSGRLRQISHHLHPSIITDLGIAAALTSLAEEFRQYGLHILSEIQTIPALPVDSATALYRIAQEALRNVQKHASGATVHLSLNQEAGTVQLCVQDDGPGFSLAGSRNLAGLGLVSMQERATLAGGVLLLSASPGNGVTVRVRIPITG